MSLDTMDINKHIWTCPGTNGHMGTYKHLWIPNDTYGYLYTPLDTYKHIDMPTHLWTQAPIDTNKHLWLPMTPLDTYMYRPRWNI